MKNRIKNLRLILILVLFCFFQNTSYAKIHWIQLFSGSEFLPDSIDVLVGDTIMFMLYGGAHTTSSTNIPANAVSWDEPIDASNGIFYYTVLEPGLYEFECTLHGGKGKFIAASPSLDLNYFRVLSRRQ